MGRSILVFSLILIAAVLMDTVVGPFMLGQWVSLRFTAAAVILTGLKRGRWPGLVAGWMGGLLLGSLSSAPLGLYMLSFGSAGFVAGFVNRFALLRIPILDAGLLIVLLFLEDAISGLAAQVFLGVSWRPAFLGIFASALLILLLIRRRMEKLIA